MSDSDESVEKEWVEDYDWNGYEYNNTYMSIYKQYNNYKLNNESYKKNYSCYNFIYQLNKLIDGGGLLRADETKNPFKQEFAEDGGELEYKCNDEIMDDLLNEIINHEYEIIQNDTLIFGNNPILNFTGNDESNLHRRTITLFLDEVLKKDKSFWENNFNIIQCENGVDFDTLAEVLRPSGKWDDNIWRYNDKNIPEIYTCLMRRKNVRLFDINENRDMKYIQLQKGDKYYHLESSKLDRSNMMALSAKMIYNNINTFLDNNNGTMLSMIRIEGFCRSSATDHQCYIFTSNNKYVHIIIRNYCSRRTCKWHYDGITASAFDFYECKLQINNIPEETTITVDYFKEQLITCDNISILYCYNTYRGINFDVILLELKMTYDIYRSYTSSEDEGNGGSGIPVEYGDYENETKSNAVAFITGNDLIEALIGYGNTYNKCSDCKSYHQDAVCPYKD